MTVWFKAKKLSMIEDKTKYMVFQKQQGKDRIPLKLPTY